MPQRGLFLLASGDLRSGGPFAVMAQVVNSFFFNSQVVPEMTELLKKK